MLTPDVTDQLERALRDLAYGSIQLVIHEAKIVRIERIERIRLTDSSEALPVISGKPTPSKEDCSHAQQEG